MVVSLAKLLMREGSRRKSLFRRPLRQLSSQDAPHSSASAETPPPNRQKQPFVQIDFDPGEWDPETRTNPLYRPKFRSDRARIISADDFARRPPVGFTGEFANFEEAMVTLTWMTHEEQREIYDMYTQMMLGTEQQTGNSTSTTSHEYVIRFLAQKYSLASDRVAAIIQLQHNEQQIIEQGGRVDYELGEYVDKKMKEEIKKAYEVQKRSSKRRPTPKQEPPSSFVEDPVGALGLTQTKSTVPVSDLHMVKDDSKREDERARRIIDSYRYREDVDPRTVAAPRDKNCEQLLTQHEELTHPDEDPIVLQQRKQNRAKEPEWPKSQRARWNYICQTTTTTMENNFPRNTLVENDGKLSPATVAQAQSVAWKATRDDSHHTYADVQQAWLDRVNGSDKHVWGVSTKKPVVFKEKEDQKTEESSENEETNETDTVDEQSSVSDETDTVGTPADSSNDDSDHTRNNEKE